MMKTTGPVMHSGTDLDVALDPDDSEEEISRGAERLLRDAFPIERWHEGNVAARASWAAMGDAGWLSLASSPEEEDAPSLATMCSISRAAGRVLALDEWTNNGVIIPGLLASVADPDERDALTGVHLTEGGFLRCDGRLPRLDLEPGSSEPDWVYGIASGLSPYTVQRSGSDQWQLVIGSPTTVHVPVDGLALGVGRLSGTDATGQHVALDGARMAGVASRAVLAHSAGLVGLAEEAIARTAQYLGIRTQFGRLIGEFQALKHLLARVEVQTAMAWSCCLRAARQPQLAHLCAARITSADAATLAATTMVQLFGGIGFTMEADCHLFLKTAVLSSARFGSADMYSRRLGESYLTAEPRPRTGWEVFGDG